MTTDDRAEFAQNLAQRLKEARRAQQLTLEALAERSGLSRSMLSSIERGESSPTVASLWNLTQALNVDFSGLLDDSARGSGPIMDLVRADRAPVIHSRGEGCRIKILSGTEDVGETEVYDVAFETGGALLGAAHRRGCVEHVTVLSGVLEATAADAAETVREGDTIRYRADIAHALRAIDGPARALMIVKGP